MNSDTPHVMTMNSQSTHETRLGMTKKNYGDNIKVHGSKVKLSVERDTDGSDILASHTECHRFTAKGMRLIGNKIVQACYMRIAEAFGAEDAK